MVGKICANVTDIKNHQKKQHQSTKNIPISPTINFCRQLMYIYGSINKMSFPLCEFIQITVSLATQGQISTKPFFIQFLHLVC